jgi:hypothetical protein
MRAISVTWNLRVSRNCASSGGMPIWVYFAPFWRMPVLWAFPEPACIAFQLSRSVLSCSGFRTPGISIAPPSWAPLPKNVAPKISAAFPSATASRARPIGVSPRMPFRLRPGMWMISSGANRPPPPSTS